MTNAIREWYNSLEVCDIFGGVCLVVALIGAAGLMVGFK